MSDTKETHKICLKWNGGRKTISLTPEMTMKELFGMARHVVFGENHDTLVELSLGHPPTPLNQNNDKAVTIVPKMSLVQVRECKKRVRHEEEPTELSTSVKKFAQTPTGAKKNTAAVVDLTDDDDDAIVSQVENHSRSDAVVSQVDRDAELARKLQQQEEQEAASHRSIHTIQQAQVLTSTMMESDEALARSIDQQERMPWFASHPLEGVGIMSHGAESILGPQQQQHQQQDDFSFPQTHPMCQQRHVDNRDPTTVTSGIGNGWIFRNGPQPFRNEDLYGKWLIRLGHDSVDKTWKIIGNAVSSGQLQHAMAAKVSTTYGRISSGYGTHVICVYTKEADIDQVGLNLIPLVQHNHICYKTNEATMLGQYSNSGHRNIAEKTLYWNNGRPTFAKPQTSVRKITPKQSQERAIKAKERNPELSHTFDDRLVTVVGIQHTNVSEHDLKLQAPVALIREPSNTHDSNAIRVDLIDTHLPKRIGHVRQKVTNDADVLAPWLDSDLIRIESAQIHRCDKDENGTIVAVAVQIKGRACFDAIDALNRF